MDSAPSSPSLTTAASELRALTLAAPKGELIGDEEAVRTRLGVSRNTVRQAARLLEREGLLRVRRGKNGGYFAARPDLAAIEAAVSGYLKTLEIKPEDATMIASTLWVEVMRKAATEHSAAAHELIASIRKRLTKIHATSSFNDVRELEQESRQAIFALVNNRYIELIFQINAAFAHGNFRPGAELDETEAHRAFVTAWKSAKQLELAAIETGDGDMAALAGRHARIIWDRRIAQHQLGRQHSQ